MADFPTPPPLPDEAQPTGWLARNRKSVILGGIALVLLAVVIAIASRTPRPSTANTNSVSTESNANAAATNGNGAVNRPTFRRFTPLVVADKDRDGLTDEEERTAKTDAAKVDTDGDGLSDYEEVKVYRTNPLQADTDGDGRADGLEVRAGDNPSGSGPLRDLGQTIQQLEGQKK